MSALGSLVVKLSLDHAEYTKGLDRNSQEALKFAQRTQRTFDNAASNVKSFAVRSIAQVGAFVGALAGINASLTSALAFDRQLAEVSTLLSGTTEEMQALRGESERLAREFGTLPTDQAKAFYQVISAGASTAAEATDILTAANRLAVGGVTDVLTAADALTSIMNVYGDRVESATAVSDALFVGMKAGKTTIAELSAGMGKIVSLAKPLNVGFDELVATIAALTKSSISTAESFTGVRAILAAVAKPTSEAKKLAGDLGIEFNAAGLQAKGFAGFLDDLRARTGGSVEQLSLLFGGVEALVPIMALSGQAGADFAAIMGQMGYKAGATEEAFNKMADSRGFKIDKLMASINSIALTLGDTLANVLAPAAEWTAQKLDNLFGAKQELSAIEKKEKELASLRKELAALNDKKNIPVIGDLIFDKRQADLLAQRIEDGEDDLKRLTAAFEETAKEAQETKKPIQELTNSLSNLPLKTDSGAKSFKNLSKSMDVVDKDAAEAEREIRRLTLAYDPLIKRNEELSRVTQLVASGLRSDIADQEYARIINDYMAATATAVDTTVTDVNAGLQRINDKSVDVFGSMEQFAIQGLRNIQSAVADGLFRSFDDGLDGMLKSVKYAVGRIASEFFSIKLLQGSGLAGLLGFGSTAALASGGAVSGGGSGLSALNLASLGSGALNLVQGGFGLTGAIGGGLQSLGGAIGSNSLFQFGAGVGGDLLGAGIGTAGSLGAGLGALAGPAAIAGIADIGLRQLFGDKKLGGTAGDILSYVPVVGTLINGLFGRGAPKFQNEALVGNVSTGGFEGVLNQAYREKGGLARSDRVSNFIADTDTGALLNQFGRLSESGNIPGSLRDSVTDPATKRALEVGQFLDEAFGSIGDTLKQTAEKLGLSSEALNNFSAELDLVSEKGETLSEAQISEEINRITDAMITTLIPNLDELAKNGEASADTLNRLNAQFSVLESAAMLFGNTSEQAAEKVRALGVDGQTALIDSLGGAEVARAQFSEFYNNVFTDAQKLEYTKNQILDVLKPLGIDFVPTLDQLYAAVESGNPKLSKAALEIDGLVVDFNQLTEAINGVSTAANQLIDASTELPETLNHGLINAETLAKQEAAARARDKAIRRESETAAINAAIAEKETIKQLEIQGLRERAEREKELVRERYRLEEQLLDKAKQKGGIIGGFVDALRGAARSILPDTFDDALGLVQRSIASVNGGASFDSIINDRLRDSLASLDDISAATFSTFEEFKLAQGAAASAVNELAGLGDEQLSIEQLSLGQLEAQTDLLKQMLDRDLRRVESGLQFDISTLGSLNGIATAGDTYKAEVLKQFQRSRFILENDLFPDASLIASARGSAGVIGRTSTADFNRRRPAGVNFTAVNETRSGRNGMDQLITEINRLINMVSSGNENSAETARILKRVTQGGDKLRTV